MNLLIDIYWKFCIFLIIIYLVVHYVVVLPFLSKRSSAGIISWITNLRQDTDLLKYRDFCIEEGKSLYIYYFLSKINIIGIGLLIGWIILLGIDALFGK